MNILKIKDPQGNWVDIPALKGDKGDKGDPGISPTIDSTLSQANQAADAKAVGDKIDEITLTIDETLTQSGQVADAKVTGDALNTKADQNGYYENLNVGVADQLASKNYIEDNEAYTFRPTANGDKVGTREFDTIIGGSIVWNQRYGKTGDATSNGITFTNNNGSISVSGVCTGTASYYTYAMDTAIPIGHVMLVCGSPGGGSNSTYDMTITGGIGETPTIYGQYRLLKPVAKPAAGLNIDIRNGYDANENPLVFTPQIFDLTQMFGSEIADYVYSLEQTTPGAGVTWFRKYFPEDYYDYNPGELMHVNDLQSHDVVGFNLWDGNLGKAGSTYRIIPLSPVLKTNLAYMAFKDKDTSIDVSNVAVGFVNSNNSGASLQNSEFRWCKQATITSYTYNVSLQGNNKLDGIVIYPKSEDVFNRLMARYDICINLSGTRNGEYEPYVKHSYPLDSSLTLRGIPKLVNGKLTYDGDVYKSDGTIERRYEIVDLGTLNWSYNSSVAVFYTKLGSSQTKYLYSGICFADYKYSTNTSLDKMWGNSEYMGGGVNLFFKDPAYTDAASFKATLSGVYFVYELETPITETAQPYQSPQIIDPYGTEEYVTTSIVPVGHQTQYPEDLRAKIESLPWDFANLIAPVEATYKATRNYTAGSLFIINNILYKATANITNGGTITPNTNCITTTLAEIIAAL